MQKRGLLPDGGSPFFCGCASVLGIMFKEHSIIYKYIKLLLRYEKLQRIVK